jgi:uncharacterized protein
MNTKFFALTSLLCVSLASAQLSAPIAGGKPASGGTPLAGASAPAAGAPAVPQGQGAGVHSPNSPFAPLVERADVVPWSVLTSLKTKTEKNRILPVFSMDQLALNQRSQRVQGFMMPLEPGDKQRHFLLTSVPMSCSFCIPGGPESMVEVRTKTPVKYTLEPVVVEGKFAVLNDDPYGLYYRLTEAASVK